MVKGDCLWTICKRFYGDGSLAYKLATANNIKNPNLIYPGQVLTLPDKAVLVGYAATPAPTVTSATNTSTSASGGSGSGETENSTSSWMGDARAKTRATIRRFS